MVTSFSIRLSVLLQAMRRDPRDHVGDFLLRHGAVRNVTAPIRDLTIGSSGDHRGAERLIRDQREIVAIEDVFAVGGVAPYAEYSISGFATLSVTCPIRLVFGQSGEA